LKFDRLAILAIILIVLGTSPARSQPDSVQIYLYHGLDEMGAGSSFSGHWTLGLNWARLNGQALNLYRRPPSTQGDLKSSLDFRAQLGRSIFSNLDLEGIFEGDFYHFRQYDGPLPLQPEPLNPAGDWMTTNPAVPVSGPPQRISSPLLALGAIYRPVIPVSLTATVGRRWDQREGFDDHGYSGSVLGELDGWSVGKYRNDLEVYGQQEALGNRLNRELKVQYGLNTEFTSSTSDKLEIYYRQKRHDYHVWGTDLIGTRLDTDHRLSNQINYQASEKFRFLLDTQFGGSRHEDQSVGANTLREEVTTAAGLTLLTELERMTSSSRLKLDWGAQEDATGLKRERGVSLEEDLLWRLAQSDSLDFAAAVRKRQYDTSDTANYDDRDRLRYEFQVYHSHLFSRYFRLASRAQVILEHLVYIFGQKSDQNNWNRIFRIGPEVYFSPAVGWGNLAKFELAANYNDYDFELDLASIKSTVYRRYTASDSLGWTWQRGWDLIFNYSLDLEDGGRLKWADWVEQIAEEYRTHKASVKVNRQTPSGILFQTGFSIYQRKGWQYELGSSGQTERTPFLLIDRWGPMLRVLYPSKSGVEVDITGDFSRVHQWLIEDYSIVNLDVRITYR
jgi:hypothetical protein